MPAIGRKDPVELYCTLALDFGTSFTAYVGGFDGGSLDLPEPLVGYHDRNAEILTGDRETGFETRSGWQFDWGGCLPKSNGGAQRYPQRGRQSRFECKGKRVLDCKTDKSSRCESRA